MYDVAVVGAGIVGACVARELSRYSLKTVVLEKAFDVSTGSSKANSGIVHEGYDAKPGTLKAKYNVLGQRMFEKLARELEFPFRRNGSLVVAFEEQHIEKLEELKAQGVANGLDDLRIIFKDELLKIEPNLNDNVFAALLVPTGGIVCPFLMTIAMAENAAINGVEFRLNSEVKNIVKNDGYFTVTTVRGVVDAKVIVNAAGLYSDKINNMLSNNKIKITPRRGEYCVIDKTEGNLVERTIFQLPTEMGKGILVTPTVDGNLLIGPTSEDIEDKEDYSTTDAGLANVLNMARRSVNKLPTNKIITSFTGLRPHTTPDDFIIGEAEDVPGLINLCAIESPGLTSAPAIALEAVSIAVEILKPEENKDFNPIRKAIPRFSEMTAEERVERIKENPDYGQIICRCESISKAEILAALRSPLGIREIDAIKRRTRAGTGRCQAGFCLMRIPDIIAAELGIDITEVTKYGGNSNLLIEKNKSGI